MQILDEKTIETLMKTLNFNDDQANNLEDLTLRSLHSYVRFLESCEINIIEMKLYDAEILFYSRYCWFCRFIKRWTALYGYDAGLEQQSFKMLEYYEGRFPHKIDWKLIEQLENKS